MKFLIILVLAFATVIALPNQEFKPRNIVVPAGRPEGRITNGKTAKKGEFPYQVGLYVQDFDKDFHWCGGSLIGNEWVLTAAHCTKTVSDAKVYLGSLQKKTGEVTYDVFRKNFITHENFDSKTLENDIALIKIPHTNYTKTIQPVKLPALNEPAASHRGESATASGWGFTHQKGQNIPTNLQWARLNIIINRICQKEYAIFQSNICTETVKGINICEGDSGGPLVLDATKEQIGIASFSSEKCLTNEPGVFTRTTSFLKWIKEKTKISY